MEAYKQILKEEVEVLRKKGKAFLAGDISRNELKGFSGGLGSYSQRETGKFMIRLRTPSGILTKEHFRRILDDAGANGQDKIHLTTRQAIQIHDLTIDQVCDIMKDGIDHDLFTRGGGGNFPRNVSLSPMAGVDREEAFDVTPYARQAGDYFLRNATGYKLPRKLKVAFSATPEDTACATVNDMGFIGGIHEGRPMFRLWLAGGMGGQPALGLPYDAWVEPTEILYYIEAMIRLFMAEGDYENKGRARTRFIPRRMGVDAFMECYKKHLREVRESCSFEGIEPEIFKEASWDSEADHPWMIPQKQKDLYTVVLHPLCGQLFIEDGEKILKMISEIPAAEIRLSMDEELYVRNLSKAQAEALLEAMKERMMMTKVRMSVSCIGTPTCQVGVNQSQALCRAIERAVASADMDETRLPRIYISGCPNSCARHPVAALGFSGCRIKAGDESIEAFECHIGGKVGMDTSVMAKKAGVIPAEKIPGMIVELGEKLSEEKKSYTEAAADGTAEAVIKKYCQ
ncbi:nitrite/sulfite reductase [Frisingicoccus sp.]|uniref:nitrite/sulfite reductase n=1 Tax=Frisingicoccus sp. TaxID=1918627 RepID=UPI0015BD28C2|nr:nitrite/sulfite reductase [Frisingicoccus sp.]MEE0751829.1 nitrite/sulfite reductase [Frisingicoccus sp.]